jgi:3-deoxy-D-manno-octulosonic-acid transferase
MIAPLVVLRWLWRSRREPLYRHALGERFGFQRGHVEPGRVWVHAVSLGETRAAAALIDAVRAQHPGLRLLLTHGTATGREAGRALLREGDAQAWLPYDTPGAVRRFLAHWQPRVGVLMETEVWPNLLRGARAAGVPMLLANARLSERSLRRGLRFAALLRPAMAALDAALAQTEADAARLREAGVMQVRVIGNLKFDMAIDPALLALGRAWAALADRPIVLAASTREGEEAMLLAAWRESGAAASARLWIVPRHPQRFDDVARLVEQQGWLAVRRSAWGATGEPDAVQRAEARAADVWIGDSLGEMPAYYAAARVALLGGSFAPLGGQNLIEAAACGCPVVMGPHTFNFADAAARLLALGAAQRVPEIGEGVRSALALAASDATRTTMSSRGLRFATSHRGAAEAMAASILAASHPGAVRPVGPGARF